ncbi:hypothetical protein HDV05_007393 [Chytridiales sp. JEL 0842]|nr:hypothetical protein HDV05_007393 [Chytridiales sp. JEL 0842]
MTSAGAPTKPYPEVSSLGLSSGPLLPVTAGSPPPSSASITPITVTTGSSSTPLLHPLSAHSARPPRQISTRLSYRHTPTTSPIPSSFKVTTSATTTSSQTKAPSSTPKSSDSESHTSSSSGNDDSDNETLDPLATETTLNQFPSFNSTQRVSSTSSATTSATSESSTNRIAEPPKMTPAPNARRKTPLAPGHSAMDWNKLKNSSADLRGGITAIKRYKPSEIALHNKKDDCWMALQGKVYNVTHYLKFHPGGVGQLMRGAGKNATELFMTVHPWVNTDHLLGDKCMVGYLVPEDYGSESSISSSASSPQNMLGAGLGAHLIPTSGKSATSPSSSSAKSASTSTSFAVPSLPAKTPPNSSATSNGIPAPNTRTNSIPQSILDSIAYSQNDPNAHDPFHSSDSNKSSSSSANSAGTFSFAVPALPHKGEGQSRRASVASRESKEQSQGAKDNGSGSSWISWFSGKK